MGTCLVKPAYFYLLGLAVASLCLCLRNGPKMITFKDTIYHVFVLIFGLSLVQIRDCIILIASPIGPTWWVPLVCKHASLWVYVLILLCVQSCERRESHETGVGASH